MSIEGNITSGFLLTDEHASRLYRALNKGFNEAMHTAEQLLEHHDGMRILTIQLLDDGSIQVLTTDLPLKNTIFIRDVMSR